MDTRRSLTRRQFDDVIRRATELAAAEADSGEGRLEEDELFRIAREVGLSEEHVRRALSEVRSMPEPKGALDRLFGPDTVRASRVVPGSRASLVRTLDEFFVASQLLQPVRHGGQVLHYRPAVDWASQIARAASATSRRYYVAAAKRVEVRLEELGDEQTIVELEVDPGTRRDAVAGAAMLGGAGGWGAGIGVGFAVATMAPLALAVGTGVLAGGAAFGGIAWVTGRYHQRKYADVRSEVEGILDRLEAGLDLEPPPPSWRRWVKRHFHGVARDLGSTDEDGNDRTQGNRT